MLTVFDAHDAFPILTLRLLRSGGAPNHEGIPSSSSPPPPPLPTTGEWGGLQASVPGDVGATAAGGASRGGDAAEDWTIVSGGADGAVAHWSVVGLASAREVADGVEEAGVELHKIGDYEVREAACTGVVWRAHNPGKFRRSSILTSLRDFFTEYVLVAGRVMSIRLEIAGVPGMVDDIAGAAIRVPWLAPVFQSNVQSSTSLSEREASRGSQFLLHLFFCTHPRHLSQRALPSPPTPYHVMPRAYVLFLVGRRRYASFPA